MNIKTNSQHVKKKDIFICIHDEKEDRHKYIKQIKKASAIIVDKDIKQEKNIPIIKVDNTNNTFFEIYNTYYNNPLENLNIIAITGTDGKTTTASIINQILNSFTTAAYLGTNGFIYKNKHEKTKNTTPPIDITLKYANILKKENIKNLVIEASSEGLLHNRCNNLPIKRAILTNITKEHLNVHKTLDSYRNSKLKLFNLLQKDAIAITNIDDKSYTKIKNKKINLLTYGTNKKADYQIKNIKETKEGTTFTIKNKNKYYQINSPLYGIFNVYNLTSAIACIHSLNYSIETIIPIIKNIKPIPGRMNFYKTKKDQSIILDYAHTEKATKEILTFANNIKKRKIITILGSAGERDKQKRKQIGKIATTLSDKVIFTMDDPRYEKFENIIKDLTKNCEKNNYIVIKNRKKAIKAGIKTAKKDDLILILGKGADNYMAIKNKRKKYSDEEQIKKYI